MNQRLGVGAPLHADLAFLSKAQEALQEADWFEVCPETVWQPGPVRLERNRFHALFAQIQAQSERPIVGHGLAFSLGTPLAGDEKRTAMWLERLRDDHAVFKFPWLADHMGWSVLDGVTTGFPLPLPFTDEAIATAVARLKLLAGVGAPVAFENSVAYFQLGDPLEEPAFLNAVLEGADASLVLDLHNVYVQAENGGMDPNDFLDALDLDRVIEIHVSGGSDSDPGWLASGRTLRLDVHDAPVPEPVWGLLEGTISLCPALRGVLLERSSGTLAPEDVAAWREELQRAKELFPC